MYGLLPSNSCLSLNTSLVKQSITKMADKMATAYQFTLIIYYPITSKFHIYITFIKFLLCPINKMAAKMAATYQFTLVDTLT